MAKKRRSKKAVRKTETHDAPVEPEMVSELVLDTMISIVGRTLPVKLVQKYLCSGDEAHTDAIELQLDPGSVGSPLGFTFDELLAELPGEFPRDVYAAGLRLLLSTGRAVVNRRGEEFFWLPSPTASPTSKLLTEQIEKEEGFYLTVDGKLYRLNGSIWVFPRHYESLIDEFDKETTPEVWTFNPEGHAHHGALRKSFGRFRSHMKRSVSWVPDDHWSRIFPVLEDGIMRIVTQFP